VTEAALSRSGLEADELAPKWQRVVERIVSDIEHGVLRTGSRLPSERDLCEQLDVSRVTLRRAFQALQERGVLRPSRGRGWFVAGRTGLDWPGTVESYVGAAFRLGQTAGARLVRISTAPAGVADAEAFGIRPGEDITTFIRAHLLDDRPAVLEVVRMVADVVPEKLPHAADDQQFIEVLSEAGLPIASTSATARPILAGDDHVEAFGVEPGTPLVELRVEITAEGRLLVDSRLQYSPDHPLRIWF
jgi:DNA-binding GntR family transcriptional regulator